MSLVSGIVFYALKIWAPLKVKQDGDVAAIKSSLWVKVAALDLDYQVVQSASDKKTYTVLPHGKAYGIVSDPQDHVFVLIRRLHRPQMISSAKEWSPDALWHISDATIKASGDWEGAVCGYPHIEFDAPDYEYWEIMAIATHKEDAVRDKITPEVCAISDEDINGLAPIITCSETAVSMRPPISGGGYYIDSVLAPKPRQWCKTAMSAYMSASIE
jgi:hypothetical protein